MEMYPSFGAVVSGMAKLFLLMALGYVLYRTKYVNDSFVDKLSQILVRILFPALIFSRIVARFSFSEYPYWWILPIAAMLFSITGMLISVIPLKYLKNFSSDRELMCSVGFQNSGYLPMNIIVFSFASAMADKFLIYMFLFLVGFDMLMWLIVPSFFGRKFRKTFNLNALLSPPVIAICVSLLWVLFLGRGTMPGVLLDPVRQLGETSFPIAMVVMGAYLCRYRAHDPVSKFPVVMGIALKLLIFPLMVLSLLFFLPLGSDYKFFLFLEAVMPSAITLVIIGAYTNADNEFLSSTIFYGHIIAILAIPLWFKLFCVVFGV